MKILLTVHQFLPEYSSGTETLTYSTARELRSMGHDVLVFTGFPAKKELTDGARIDKYEYDGLKVVRFHHAHVPMGGQINIVEAEYNNRLVARKFSELLHQFRPQIVHFFHLSRLSASLIDVCRKKGIPMVFTATDFWFVCPMNQLRLPDNSLCNGPDRSGVNCLRHVVEQTQSREVASKLKSLPDLLLAVMIAGCRAGVLGRWSYSGFVKALAARPQYLRARINMLDRVLVPTHIMESILVQNGLNASKVTFCSFGIDIPVPSRTLNDDSISRARDLRVGFIGTLYEHKGAHLLVEAVRRLAGKPITLKVYGRLEEFPDYATKLRDVAGGDSRIQFLGTFPNSEIGNIFATLDVLVVPSLWYENSPLVVYSAQACKCPVIAADVAGLSEVVSHEDNGLLFPKGEANALANLLDRLSNEPALLASLRKHAREPKSSRQYAADLCAIYKELLSPVREERKPAAVS